MDSEFDPRLFKKFLRDINTTIVSTNPKTGKKEYTCPHSLCGKVYMHQGSLLRHLKFECGQLPKFQCSHCSYRTNRKDNIKSHILWKHDPSKRIQCVFCLKVFVRKCRLLEHYDLCHPEEKVNFPAPEQSLSVSSLPMDMGEYDPDDPEYTSDDTSTPKKSRGRKPKSQQMPNMTIPQVHYNMSKISQTVRSTKGIKNSETLAKPTEDFSKPSFPGDIEMVTVKEEPSDTLESSEILRAPTGFVSSETFRKTTEDPGEGPSFPGYLIRAVKVKEFALGQTSTPKKSRGRKSKPQKMPSATISQAPCNKPKKSEIVRSTKGNSETLAKPTEDFSKPSFSGNDIETVTIKQEPSDTLESSEILTTPTGFENSETFRKTTEDLGEGPPFPGNAIETVTVKEEYVDPDYSIEESNAGRDPFQTTPASTADGGVIGDYATLLSGLMPKD
ncbi:RE1-silencing transcription factor-like [Macrosteles quadrilineatus]|uniref:RE1-silencing transcription factor-like n=1 Tax=Macrosteles quadrilineatus TaxID=74068 RepID=UPI0023E2924E|nr:RE1-silencing transcription factor-like [Macrosteles quadrilineatus]